MRASIGKYPRKSGSRKTKITFSDDDFWSLDSTLSKIIHPALVEFKARGPIGAPHVDDDDVPAEIRSTSSTIVKKNEWDTDEFFFKRWEWVLDEMIFAHSEIASDLENEPEYVSRVEDEEMFIERDDGLFVYNSKSAMIDEDKKSENLKYHERISNGLRLFGKYYRGIWE